MRIKFDLNIWEKIKLRFEQKRKISVESLESDCMDEMIRMKETFKSEIMKQYRFKISINSLGNNKQGFTYYAKCASNYKTKCKTLFRFRVNVETGQAHLSASIKCDHLM